MDETYFWIMAGVVMVPLMVLASWMDWRYHRIPNWLNLELALSGLILHIYFDGWSGITTGVTGLIVGMGLLIIPWLMHLMGPGDVKFLGAIGLWLGPKMVVESFVIGALIGGVIAVVMIFIAKRIRAAMENLSVMIIKCNSPQLVFSEMGKVNRIDPHAQLMPYGVPLTIGTLIVMVLYFTGCW